MAALPRTWEAKLLRSTCGHMPLVCSCVFALHNISLYLFDNLSPALSALFDKL